MLPLEEVELEGVGEEVGELWARAAKKKFKFYLKASLFRYSRFNIGTRNFIASRKKSIKTKDEIWMSLE